MLLYIYTLAAALVLFAAPAAATVKTGPVGTFVRAQATAIPAPGVDLDLTASAAGLSVTRAGTAYIDNVAGTWSSVAADTARQSDKGLLVEESRTNVVLQNRDLTNAAWVKTNITAAKTQTGVDGVVNSASSLTAGAANGTALQAITLASSARWHTAFVKRLTGAGNVQMTMDNGATWTNVTVTAGWTRVAIPTQTIANPTVGFRLVTSGDAIAVDMVQNEASNLFATSPIATTSAAVTRDADSVTLTSPPSFGAAFSMQAAGTPLAPITFTGAQYIASIDDGTLNNREALLRANGTGNAWGFISTGGVQLLSGQISPWAQNTAGAIAVGGTSNSYAVSFNGSAATTSATVGNMPAVSVVRIGRPPGTGLWNGYITRVKIWPTTRLSDSQLQAVSQ
jgi:hypothetical protein